MLGRSVAAAITDDSPSGPFAHVAGIHQAPDITVGNLEVVLSELGRAEPKSYTFRGPTLGAAGLAAAGFDLVALANNHSMDFGAEAMLDGKAILAAASVEAAGAGANAGEAWAHAVLERNGTRIAFLSIAEVPDEAGYSMGAWAAGEDSPGIAWLGDERLATAVGAARAEADIVVVLAHFGLEGTSSPTARQRQIARLAIDSGASLVVGSHPHVLQEVEEYGGGLIAYSLGNFVFDGFDGIANRSAVLVTTFDPAGAISWNLEPVTIGWDGLPRPNE